MSLRTLVLFNVILISCQHASDKPRWSAAAFESYVKQFEGKPVQAIIDEWGYFDRELKDPDGSIVYEYSYSHYFQDPAYLDAYPVSYSGFYRARIIGGTIHYISCQIWLKTKDDKISQVTWRGNGCLKQTEPNK